MGIVQYTSNIDIMKKFFAKKEIKDLIKIVDDMALEVSSEGYKHVQKIMKDLVYKQSNEIVDSIQSGKKIESIAYSEMANLCGDLLESGHYHLHRGLINPMGIGEDLLGLYDYCVDKLVSIGDIDSSRAKSEKDMLRRNIKSVG